MNSNTAANISKAREHYETRASRRPVQVFNTKSKTWRKLKKRQDGSRIK